MEKLNKLKPTLQILIILYTLFNPWAWVWAAEEKHLSNLDAIRIAENYFKDKGRCMENMGIQVLKYFPPFSIFPDMKDYYSIREGASEFEKKESAMLLKRKKLLEETIHWVVTYHFMSKSKWPDKGFVGGTYRVYIDAKTGEILFSD